jgi:NAD dependent epimerase/dehydratase
MKTTLVTGADGFIGSHLTELLLSKGYHVRALAQYNSFNNWGWLEDVPQHPNLEILTGDIRDAHFCKTLTQEVDIVFHLAGLTAIPHSYIAPDSYVETNIGGTLNLCQGALENGVGRFVHISSSQVYGTALYVPVDEKHPKQAQSPYAASKIGADAMAMSFYHSYSFPVTIARPFNTYGPREPARNIIPSTITQMLAGKVIKVGDLTPTRDMNYVTDTCNGILLLAENDNTIGTEINICSNTEISMGDMLRKIKGYLNVDVEFEKDEQRLRPAGSEVYRLYGNNGLLKELTGYQPEVSINEGLKTTCDWFKKSEHRSKYKASVYNV